ncbi:spermidine/putrescine ABC transporter permease PotC [Candidatus Ishikawella capsulata]|uniref:Spermidine/putrescine transport system permease protein PotC n=1 Tax=Candidatus Ishikawaella capsulata Mpkobe TaxID=476281 RepID=C5WD08_9ENTR|nr:spermidine/putrescine ABC transporter permease PotC [Candidatus Ishikawaella capsulata]BAH83214.1 spermidine/putrescine ABC transporter membrane protein [Candidatus Ishikawaella capsulata Mpkobe]
MIVKWLRHIFMAIVYFCLYVPLVILIANSFNTSRFGIMWKGFSLYWYTLLMHNNSLIQAAEHSLLMGMISSTFATIIGSLTAVALYRYHFKGKSFIRGMLFVIMMSPDILMAISLLVLFILLKIPFGFCSLLLSHITFCLPFVVITVYSRLAGFDNFILEAAKDLGAKETTILSKIILPLAMPAILAGYLMSFTLSLDDVVISSFVTSPTFEILPLKIYSMIKIGLSPEINAIAAIFMIISLLLVVISQLLLNMNQLEN